MGFARHRWWLVLLSCFVFSVGCASAAAPETEETTNSNGSNDGTADSGTGDIDAADTNTTVLEDTTPQNDTASPEDTASEDGMMNTMADTSSAEDAQQDTPHDTSADSATDISEDGTSEDDTSQPDTAPDSATPDTGEDVSDPCIPDPCLEVPEPRCDLDGVTLLTADGPGMCTIEGDAAQCSFTESMQDCSLDGGHCAEGVCTGSAQSPVAGEVIFTELMVDPHYDLGDSSAEWFELYNRAPEPRYLGGCIVSDSSEEDSQIDGVLLMPGGYAVFARSNDAIANGGLTPNGLFSFGLTNDGDALVLSCGGAIIDRVVFDEDWPLERARALSLDPSSQDPTANDVEDNWCLATSVYYESATPEESNYGTPGTANSDCPEPDPCDPDPCQEVPEPECTNGTTLLTRSGPGICEANPEVSCGWGEVTTDCAALSPGGTCADGACVGITPQTPSVGDLIISEILYDPQGELAEDRAEWVELYNASMVPLALDGCTLKDASSSSSAASLDGLTVEPDGYVLLVRSATNNGGLVPDATFSFALNNSGGDTLTLRCGAVIDTVDYDDGGSFPDASAASVALDPGAYSSTANDDGMQWCIATDPYYSGATTHLGTPKSRNRPCP